MEIGKYITAKVALLVLLVCMTITSNVYSAPKINYRGMVHDKAWILVNGRLIKLTSIQTVVTQWKLSVLTGTLTLKAVQITGAGQGDIL